MMARSSVKSYIPKWPYPEEPLPSKAKNFSQALVVCERHTDLRPATLMSGSEWNVDPLMFVYPTREIENRIYWREINGIDLHG